VSMYLGLKLFVVGVKSSTLFHRIENVMAVDDWTIIENCGHVYNSLPVEAYFKGACP